MDSTLRNQSIMNDIYSKQKLKLKVEDPNYRIHLKQYYKVDREVTVVRFDSEDSLLAVGDAKGDVEIYEVSKNDRLASRSLGTGQQKSLKLPTSGLRWRTGIYGTKNKFTLITANTDGTIRHFNVKNGNLLQEIKEEAENEVYAIDLSKDESFFVTSGKDCKVRIYDQETYELKSILEAIQWTSTGHNNRLFSVKVHPTDMNIVISGGWDQNIAIWDIREKRSVAAIFGPKIAGDSLDIRGNTILSGSNRMSEQIQLWDLGTQKMIENIQWDPQNPSPGAFVFGAQFSKVRPGLILGGASGTNEVRVFENQNDKHTYQGSISGFSKGIFSVDFANLSNRFAYSGADGLICVASFFTKGYDDQP